MASNIKNQLFSGVFYTALAKYSGIVISLVIAGILARLLSPDDFGIVAVATVIIAFFSLLTDMGISPAIIQHKSLTKDELSTIFSFTVWTGIGISILFFAASWMIADYYESEILRTLCQLLSVNLFFASATIVPGALFYRNKEFKFIAIRSFVIQISAGAAAVTAALCGAGLYALIINPIISSILIFVISYQRYPQRLRFTLGLTARNIFSVLCSTPRKPPFPTPRNVGWSKRAVSRNPSSPNYASRNRRNLCRSSARRSVVSASTILKAGNW